MKTLRRLALVFCLLICAGRSASAMTAQLSDGEDDDDRNFNYLMLEDIIEPGDEERVTALLDQQFEQKRRTAMVLTSPGGALEEVEYLAQAIIDGADRYYEKYHASTFLIINQECSSACNILTATLTRDRDPKALEIFVAGKAKFGFHSPVQVNDGQITQIKDPDERRARRKKMLDTYRAAGVSPQWMKKNNEFFLSIKLSEVMGLDLCRAKAGIIPSGSCYSDKLDIFDETVKAMASGRSIPTLAKP